MLWYCWSDCFVETKGFFQLHCNRQNCSKTAKGSSEEARPVKQVESGVGVVLDTFTSGESCVHFTAVWFSKPGQPLYGLSCSLMVQRDLLALIFYEWS